MRNLLALAISLLCFVTVPAQEQVFRSSVDRVRVDVVVTDGSERPVTDLTRADFSIVENGRPQVITDFRFVSVPVARRTLSESDSRAPAPDVATNAIISPSSRLWAIVIDDLHLIESDIVPIKAVLADIAKALSPDDEVAVVYVGRSDLSLNFTNDAGRLLRSIENVRAAVGFGLDALAPPDARTVRNYAARSSDTIRNVAASLAGSGHVRRAIIYVGTMTTIDPQSMAGMDFIAEELQRRAICVSRVPHRPIET